MVTLTVVVRVAKFSTVARIRGSFGVETREFGDELVRDSVDRYLRISTS
jgi:hypothetical protein